MEDDIGHPLNFFPCGCFLYSIPYFFINIEMLSYCIFLVWLPTTIHDYWALRPRWTLSFVAPLSLTNPNRVIIVCLGSLRIPTPPTLHLTLRLLQTMVPFNVVLKQIYNLLICPPGASSSFWSLFGFVMIMNI